MKIFLLKDVERIGMAGEIVKVKEGFGINFLIPRKLGVEVTRSNEAAFLKRAKKIEHRQDVISSKTSMLAEKVQALKLSLKRTTHDDGKLYGAINPQEIVDELANKGVKISKSQVEFGKSIKSVGAHEVTIKLSSKLKPKVKVSIVAA